MIADAVRPQKTTTHRTRSQHTRITVLHSAISAPPWRHGQKVAQRGNVSLWQTSFFRRLAHSAQWCRHVSLCRFRYAASHHRLAPIPEGYHPSRHCSSGARAVLQTAAAAALMRWGRWKKEGRAFRVCAISSSTSLQCPSALAKNTKFTFARNLAHRLTGRESDILWSTGVMKGDSIFGSGRRLFGHPHRRRHGAATLSEVRRLSAVPSAPLSILPLLTA